MKKIILVLIATFYLISCSSPSSDAPATLPIISTAIISNITQTGAISGGSISSDGGANIAAKGIVWNTSPNPTITLATKTNDGTGNNSFISTLFGLTRGNIYYLRAYATNSAGTVYGNEILFVTLADLPTLQTNPISNLTFLSANSGGTITDNGGSDIIAKGVVWSINQNPTIDISSKTNDGSGSVNYNSNITNIIANTTYYVRSYASNSVGTNYGNEISFTTLPRPLSVGDAYQGGIIFYIFSNNDNGSFYVPGEVHGLIAATNDLNNSYPWGCSGSLITANYTNYSWLGFGNDNTQHIVQLCGSGTAASACNDIVINGYSDWYLPTWGDTEMMQNNLTGNYALRGEYWSSTEYNSAQARVRSTTTPLAFDQRKHIMKLVRPVRTF